MYNLSFKFSEVFLESFDSIVAEKVDSYENLGKL